MSRIGIFDSGVGGLSVWREIVRRLPQAETRYVADAAHLPYGPRPAADVLRFCEGITRFLLDQGCTAIVVACNTASAAALHALREKFPGVPFVGMEPAVKPAAQRTRRGVVAVLATPGTLQGRLFAETSARFAASVRVVACPCPGLVERIEAGAADAPATQALLRQLLAPALEARADSLVLACTHYPFAMAAIRGIVGADVDIIDPAPAVARQVERVLPPAESSAAGAHAFFSSGDAGEFQRLLKELVQVQAPVAALRWTAAGDLLPAQAATA